MSAIDLVRRVFSVANHTGCSLLLGSPLLFFMLHRNIVLPVSQSQLDCLDERENPFTALKAASSFAEI